MALLAFTTPTLAQTPVTYQYAYDSAGRLTQAVDSSGVELTYTYDAAGNLLSVTRQINVLTAIFGATDANGNTITAAKIGQQVTLSGIGLGDCPNVTVTVDGIAATVVSQTTNTITFLIPVGATAGNIVVSTCHGSATFTLTIGGVTVSPSRAVLTPGGSVQFSASVLPATLDQSVTWSVDGIVGGDASVGAITADGLYTAPPGTGFVSIRATSVADPELYAEAPVSVLDSSNVYEAFSPGVSVQLGTSAVSGPLSYFTLSPGLSVRNGGTTGGGGGLIPFYALSPGVLVATNGAAGGGGVYYVLSPGLSVRNGGTTGTGGGGPFSYYALSPGVSVLPTAGTGGAAVPYFVLSPGVSVLPGTAAGGGGGGGGGGSGPISYFALSRGVSVAILAETTGGDETTVFVLTPGVSVAPAPETSRATPPRPHPGPTVTGILPAALRRGADVMTVAGTDLNDAVAVGFRDDMGRLDKNIIVRGATVSPGGHSLTLRLSVGRWAVPGRRRLVLWSLTRAPLALGRSGTGRTP